MVCPDERHGSGPQTAVAHPATFPTAGTALPETREF
jgi:hypothetical protein